MVLLLEHALVVGVGARSAVLRVAHVLVVLVVLSELKVAAFIDLFGRSDGVLKVDADFVFSLVIIDIIGLLLVLAHLVFAVIFVVLVVDLALQVTLQVTLAVLLVVGVQLNVDLVVVDDPVRVLVLIFTLLA
mmetsp:Transcript_29053/g.36019  ORF Transcript_29053/g.36019 Transcript_29053/m.36019 type:complete len:132 (-) Transcript_29053:803-1198(-)